jgi:hypothetical protein
MFVCKLNQTIYLAGKNHSANGAFVFQLQSPVKLHSGKNYVSLLSGTVGLKVRTQNRCPPFLSGKKGTGVTLVMKTELRTFV